MSDDEPQAICANCEYFTGDIDGRTICLHRNSGRANVEPQDRCRMFFPDPKRWPDADHE